VHPRILITCPGSQGTSCPCSPVMIRVEVPGSSFMLCLGPGPPSLLHLTRANAEKPYAGDTYAYKLFLKFSIYFIVLNPHPKRVYILDYDKFFFWFLTLTETNVTCFFFYFIKWMNS
jgi:hypothetical protein